MLRTSSGDLAADGEGWEVLAAVGLAAVAAVAAVCAATIPGARFARGTLRGRPALVVWTEAGWSVAAAGAGDSGAGACAGPVGWVGGAAGRVPAMRSAPPRSARRPERAGGGTAASRPPGGGAGANGLAPPGGGPDAPGVLVGSGPVLAPVPSGRARPVLAVGPGGASPRAASALAASAREGSGCPSGRGVVNPKLPPGPGPPGPGARVAPAPPRVPAPFPVGSAAGPLGCWAAWRRSGRWSPRTLSSNQSDLAASKIGRCSPVSSAAGSAGLVEATSSAGPRLGASMASGMGARTATVGGSSTRAVIPPYQECRSCTLML